MNDIMFIIHYCFSMNMNINMNMSMSMSMSMSIINLYKEYRVVSYFKNIAIINNAKYTVNNLELVLNTIVFYLLELIE